MATSRNVGCFLRLIAAASDWVMVSDSHSHSIYQVCINNNGAFLKGTVRLLIKLPEGAQPMGLVYDGNIVYVADSSSNVGITKLNPSTSETQVIVRNGTRFCHTVHGLDVSSDGSVIFIDPTSRVVRRFSQANSDIRVIAGSGADKSRDGFSLAASFSQPAALCVEGKSIFVVDTTVVAIKLITPTNSLCKFLELLHSLCRMIGVHLCGIKAECHTIDEAISSLSELSSLMDLWIDQVQEKMGRESAAQGPQGTISAKSRLIE